MSEKSDTPRTDAAVGYMEDFGGTPCASIDPEVARELERELAAARAELALHEDNARQSLEEIEALRANFTEWSCRARAFEDERNQARAELAALCKGIEEIKAGARIGWFMTDLGAKCSKLLEK